MIWNVLDFNVTKLMRFNVEFNNSLAKHSVMIISSNLPAVSQNESGDTIPLILILNNMTLLGSYAGGVGNGVGRGADHKNE